METPIYNYIRHFITQIETYNGVIEEKSLKIILEYNIYNQLLQEISYISNKNVINGIITILYGNYIIKVSCKEVESNILRDKFNQIFKSILE